MIMYTFFQGNVQKTLKKIEDVQGMCSKRRESLQKTLKQSNSQTNNVPTTNTTSITSRPPRGAPSPSPGNHTPHHRDRQPRTTSNKPPLPSNNNQHHQNTESRQKVPVNTRQDQSPSGIYHKSARVSLQVLSVLYNQDVDFCLIKWIQSNKLQSNMIKTDKITIEEIYYSEILLSAICLLLLMLKKILY